MIHMSHHYLITQAPKHKASSMQTHNVDPQLRVSSWKSWNLQTVTQFVLDPSRGVSKRGVTGWLMTYWTGAPPDTQG